MVVLCFQRLAGISKSFKDSINLPNGRYIETPCRCQHCKTQKAYNLTLTRLLPAGAGIADVFPFFFLRLAFVGIT
jgi:hypothetical protein